MEVLFGVFAVLALIAALRIVFAGNSVLSTLTPVALLVVAGVVFLILSHEFTDALPALHASQVVFYIVGALAMTGAMGVVFTRDIVHAALFLIMTLLMTAGVFVLVSAEFLSLVQILLYGGAVVILVVFALMITRAREAGMSINGPQWPFGLAAGAGLGGVLILMIRRTSWGGTATAIAPTTPERIGNALFGDWAIPFEIASLVLLVALIGAIVIARTEES